MEKKRRTDRAEAIAASSRFAKRDTRAGWNKRSECCRQHAGEKPKVDAPILVENNGQTLTIEVEATHPCGIKWLHGAVVLMAPGEDIEQGWEKELDARFACDPANKKVTQEWSFGKGKINKLPVDSLLGMRIQVILYAWSCCDDFEDCKQHLKVDDE